MTPKQEQFCHLYIETGNASEAYRQAYNAENMKPESVAVEASRLLNTPNIALMIEEIKAEHKARHNVTVDSLIAELEQAREAALKAGTPQTSAAVSASMGKAKILGLLIDKTELKDTTPPKPEPFSAPNTILPLTEGEILAITQLVSDKDIDATIGEIKAIVGDDDTDKLYAALLFWDKAILDI